MASRYLAKDRTPTPKGHAEDDPRFDPRYEGDRKYGPKAVFPKAPPGTKFSSRAGSVAGSKDRVAGHGTGPGPNGSYPPGSRMKPVKVAGARASGSTRMGRTGMGIERRGVGRGFPPGKNRRVY